MPRSALWTVTDQLADRRVRRSPCRPKCPASPNLTRLTPRRVLGIAAGTGVLTRELGAAIPAAQVTATDLNPAMVGFGSRQIPAPAWRQADALHLPLDDWQFDLVVCRFGVMFFPDRPPLSARCGGVLAPGGRVLFSTWGAVETHGFAAALVAALTHSFPGNPPAFIAAVPRGYCDLRQIAALLAAGGLECPITQSVTLGEHADSVRADNPGALLPLRSTTCWCRTPPASFRPSVREQYHRTERVTGSPRGSSSAHGLPMAGLRG